jgi:hypothetical protein
MTVSGYMLQSRVPSLIRNNVNIGEKGSMTYALDLSLTYRSLS